MTPNDQLRMLARIWPSSRKGYVFLPWIPAAQARTSARKRSWQEGRAFAWPKDREEIRAHLHEHWEDELYFTPMVFSKPYRRSEYSMSQDRLWADLDEVDPRDVEDLYKPTHAWETSPGRFAGVWVMSSPREHITEPGRENQKLTYWLGADLSGWDSTQLLRVPGSANNKAVYDKGTRGQVVWWSREIHGWDKFDALPDVDVPEMPSMIDEQMLEGIDRHEVWGKARLKVSSLIRDYMRMRNTAGYDRSDVAWQIERELADAGCTVPEIVVVMRDSIWNKFAGRQDELKRLIIEASKAAAERPDDVLEATQIVRPDMVPFWQDREYLEAPQPEWLVSDMIPKGGCGFIAGIPKSMKSWLGLDLAISAALGEKWLERDIEAPVNVLYIQEEDPITLVRWRHNIIASSKDPRWALLDADGELLPRIEKYPANLHMLVYKGFRASEEGWQAWLLETIEEYNIGLVLFDTLATIAPGIDSTREVEIKGQVLDPLKDIARQTGTTMSIIHHMRKDQTGSARAGQNMAGSGQIHAWADWGLYVKEKDEKLGMLLIDHETKYTGTNAMKFLVNELPERWAPLYQHTEDDIPTPDNQEKRPQNKTTAMMKELIPDPSAIDPLGSDLGLSATHHRLRAYIVDYAKRKGSISVGIITRDTGFSVDTVKKYVSYVRNDYPDLEED